ncbi:right-handed parallel beta-helix repeat-containing protein [soil metagenome]
MRKNHSLFVFSLVCVAILVFAGLANAQATRTWVSGVGDDANPCSRTAPCKTFAGAISKTATSGAINCLDPGGFGAVTIIKSLTIDCKQTNGGILAAGTSGIIINSSTAVVRIRGINIDGAGTGLIGIRVVAATKVNIEESEIDGFTQHGVSVESTSTARVVIDRMTIRNCVGMAVNVTPAGMADVTIANSTLSQNGTAVNAGANGTVRIAGNTIIYNTTGLAASGARGSQIISYGNNVIDGNVTNGAVTSKASLQ